MCLTNGLSYEDYVRLCKKVTMYLLQVRDIFTENILFYIYFTLLKITTSTGKSSFLLIPEKPEPECTRVAHAKDKGGAVCRSVGVARCRAEHLSSQPSPLLGVQVEDLCSGAG